MADIGISLFIRRYTLIVVILALLGLLIQGDLFSRSIPIIVGQLLALALVVSARLAFGGQQLRVTADPGSGTLITRGPYRLIRHPMYAAALLLIWVSIAGHWSIVNLGIGAVVSVFAISRIAIEERLLLEHFPDYSDYRSRTKRIIPFVY